MFYQNLTDMGRPNKAKSAYDALPDQQAVGYLVDSIGTSYSGLGIPFFIASIAAVVAIIVVIVWAIPMHFLLRHFEKSNITWYLLCAIIPAFIFVYGFKPFGNDMNADLLSQAFLCAVFGCLSALPFWYVAVYREAR